MSGPAPVELVRDGDVASIVFERPDSGNVLDLDATRAFRAAALRAIGARVIVLRSRGPIFCGGGDLGGLVGEPDEVAARMREGVEFLHEGLIALKDCGAPLLARVQGAAAGAGLSLVAASDLVLATPEASFVFGYTAIGLSPDGGGSFFLPRAIGARRAYELALSNRRVGAEEACRMGLVTEVVGAGEIDRSLQALTARLAAASSAATATIRGLIEAGATADLRTQLGAEADAIVRLAASAEGQEGMSAFLEKRRPRFAAEAARPDDEEGA